MAISAPNNQQLAYGLNVLMGSRIKLAGKDKTITRVELINAMNPNNGWLYKALKPAQRQTFIPFFNWAKELPGWTQITKPDGRIGMLTMSELDKQWKAAMAAILPPSREDRLWMLSQLRIRWRSITGSANGLTLAELQTASRSGGVLYKLYASVKDPQYKNRLTRVVNYWAANWGNFVGPTGVLSAAALEQKFDSLKPAYPQPSVPAGYFLEFQMRSGQWIKWGNQADNLFLSGTVSFALKENRKPNSTVARFNVLNFGTNAASVKGASAGLKISVSPTGRIGVTFKPVVGGGVPHTAVKPVDTETFIRTNRKVLVGDGDKLAKYLERYHPTGINIFEARTLLSKLTRVGLNAEARVLGAIVNSNFGAVAGYKKSPRGYVLESAAVSSIVMRSLQAGLTMTTVRLEGRDLASGKYNSIHAGTRFEYTYFDSEFQREFTLPLSSFIQGLNRDGAGFAVVSIPRSSSGKLRVFSAGPEAQSLAGGSNAASDDFSVSVSAVGHPGFSIGGVLVTKVNPSLFRIDLTPTLSSVQAAYLSSFQVAMGDLINRVDTAGLLMQKLGPEVDQTPGQAYQTALNELQSIQDIFRGIQDAKKRLDQAVQNLLIKNVPALFLQVPLRQFGTSLAKSNAVVLRALESVANTLSRKIDQAKKLQVQKASENLLNNLLGLVGFMAAAVSVYFGLRDWSGNRSIYQNRRYWFGKSLEKTKENISDLKYKIEAMNRRADSLQSTVDNPLTPTTNRSRAQTELTETRSQIAAFEQELKTLSGEELAKKSTKVWETDLKLQMTNRALVDSGIGIGLLAWGGYELYTNFESIAKASNFPGVDENLVRSSFSALRSLWLTLDNEVIPHKWEQIGGITRSNANLRNKPGPDVVGFVRTRYEHWLKPGFWVLKGYRPNT